MKKKMESKSNGAGPVFLQSDELTGLKNRWETFQAQKMRTRQEQLILEMVQESYIVAAQALRVKYKLPPQYTVDFKTGMVTNQTEVDDGR